MPALTAASSTSSRDSTCSLIGEGSPFAVALYPDIISQGLELTDRDEHTPILTVPYTYLMEQPGKGVRDILIDGLQLWLKIPPQQLMTIKKMIGILHNSSLLVDDIEDKSPMRRGKPSAHKVYGEPYVINTVSYMYFLATNECAKLRNADAMDFFISEMINLHHGQGMDIYWRDFHKCPSIADYQRMVVDKTGGVFRMAVHLMSSVSAQPDKHKNKPFLISLSNSLGLFFQIRDDYFNLVDEVMGGKGYCEDITEGKLSFPIIHFILSSPKRDQLISILNRRTEEVDLKRHAVELMTAAGSFKYTVDVLNVLKDKLLEQLKEISGNPILEAVIDKLSKGIPATES